MSDQNFFLRDAIPLYYTRVRGSGAVTSLSVTVTVKNAVTGAVILASTTVPEIIAGSGFYLYNWTHGQTTELTCLATYTVASQNYYETFTISDNDLTGRSY